MRYQDVRLSKHFVLMDFMQDRDIYCDPHPKPLKGYVSREHVEVGKAFCENLLEPLIKHFGPCSVAAGLCPSLTGHADGPHAWTLRSGAAADVVFHDWVNQGLAPIKMMDLIAQEEITFERIITYAGSEFTCMAYRPGFNRHALYENVRQPHKPDEKPFFKTYGASPNDRVNWPERFPSRPHWRREEGEVIYHTKRSIRPQHIRVGRYFTFLDFCKSEEGLSQGIRWVPEWEQAPSQVLYARRAAAILDPVVEQVGRLSIIKGCQPKSLRGTEPGFDWMGGMGCVDFLLPEGVASDDVVDLLEPDERVWGGEVIAHPAGEAIRMVFKEFDVPTLWSSAASPKAPIRTRTRTA